MPNVQARRTLVKSPPELWAELSDAEALARRLEAFGEIRITRLDPESTVAWEGERARGTVEIEPSGWGTRVTLTAEPNGQDEPSPSKSDPDEVRLEPSAAASEVDVVPVREPDPAEASEPIPAEPLPQTTAAMGQSPFLVPLPPPPPDPPLEPAADEEADDASDEVEPEGLGSLLDEVLDDLGSAHHRPFSRG